MAWCGNKPLPEPMLPQLYVYGHMASPNPIELKGCDLILIGIDRSTYQRHSPAEKIRYKKWIIQFTLSRKLYKLYKAEISRGSKSINGMNKTKQSTMQLYTQVMRQTVHDNLKQKR